MDFQAAVASLQPNVRDLVREFKLNHEFVRNETACRLEIDFTMDADHEVGYRRLIVRRDKTPPTVPPCLSYDVHVVPWGSSDAQVPSHEADTLDNALALVDSTAIRLITRVVLERTYTEVQDVYCWTDVRDTAFDAMKAGLQAKVTSGRCI